ncbi:PREDICTED: tumor necrosis factor receptor superfamily member 16-like [Acropora digitifera]|uniref:tumor necrosis factor receptor superfamily member 16-like n=1 Tax=Acropora digitifera TaxID=70779 RepID=UPI00077A1F4C|nr:PREDICTED: tumor necrosis factor receptor superfamily member 16-like [Acropora digitifera]
MEHSATILKGFLLASVPNLSSSRPTKCGPSQYTVFNPQNQEEIVKCQDCPTCPRGEGVPEQCGSRVPDGTSTQCKPCELGKSYSSTTDSSTCLSCHECGKKTVLQQCSLTENRKCGECPANYFLERHLNDCVECFTCCSDVPDSERMEQCGKDLGLPASQWCEPNEKNKLCAKLNAAKNDEANKTTTSTSAIVSPTSTSTVSLVESSRSSISINESTIATNLAGKNGQIGNPSAAILISSSCICILAILILAIILIYKKWSARKTSSTNRNEEYVEVETENPEVQQSNNMNMSINVDDIPQGNPQGQEMVNFDMSNIENIPEELLITDIRNLFWINNGDIEDVMIFQVQNKLDIPETVQKKTWRSVFLALKVHPDHFNKILSSGDTTFAAIDYFETLGLQQPKLRTFVRALLVCGRNDLARIICDWPYKNNEDTNCETQV